MQDGISTPLRIVTLQAEGNFDTSDDAPSPIILANGYGEDSSVLGPFAGRLISIAEAKGSQRSVIVYDPPKTYALDELGGAFGRTVDYAENRAGTEVRLVGHSLGGFHTTSKAIGMMAQGRGIASVTIISLNGATPLNCQTRHEKTFAGIMSAAEVLRLPLHLGNPTVRRIGINILAHTLSHPPSAIAQGVEILTGSVANSVAPLHEALRRIDGTSRLTVIGGDRDGVSPVMPMRRSLGEDFPTKSFIVIKDMDHGGPIRSPRWTQIIDNAIMLRDSPSRRPEPMTPDIPHLV